MNSPSRTGFTSIASVGTTIRESSVESDYVCSRLSFFWQLYKVAQFTDHDNPNSVSESGLTEEKEWLAGTLFNKIANSAKKIYKRSPPGRIR